MAANPVSLLSGSPAGAALSLKEKLVIGALVGLVIGLVSAFASHHATALVTNSRK